MATVAPETDLLTTQELADYFRVSRSTIRTWARQGRIPVAISAGITNRYRLCDVKAALNQKPGAGACTNG